MTFTLFIIGAFIIWFSSLWVAILSLLSFIGGWKMLSRLYPLTLSDKDGQAVKHSFCSIKLGLINYRSCVTISFTKTGIIIEMIKLFSTMHKPIFIPYKKISDAQKEKNFYVYTKFKIENKNISIYGKAGDELFSKLHPPDKSF